MTLDSAETLEFQDDGQAVKLTKVPVVPQVAMKALVGKPNASFSKKPVVPVLPNASSANPMTSMLQSKASAKPSLAMRNIKVENVDDLVGYQNCFMGPASVQNLSVRFSNSTNEQM